MAYCESAELDDPEIRFPEQQLPLLHGIAVVRFHDLNDGRGSSVGFRVKQTTGSN